MHPIDTVAKWIGTARRVGVLTGAGMSAESGVPTFRGGDGGLWQRFDPMQLATAAAWRRDPELVWGWYLWRMARVRAARPHAGHDALAWMQSSRPLDLITQNVDDLHERAGSRAVMHLHGSLFQCRCFDCGRVHGAVDVPADAADAPQLRRAPPRCDACGGMLRPGVVWFGEALPQEVWDAALHAVSCCDVVLVIGTSGVVQPAASLVGIARGQGARVIEINPQASAHAGAIDLHLATGAAEALAQLRERL